MTDTTGPNYDELFVTTEAHIVSQLEDLMRDHTVDYRIRGSRHASSMDQAPLLTRIRLEVAPVDRERAKALLDAFFAPIDPDDPDLPEELRPE